MVVQTDWVRGRFGERSEGERTGSDELGDPWGGRVSPRHRQCPRVVEWSHVSIDSTTTVGSCERD